MELNISSIYADGTGNIGVSGHEPNNEFYIYRLKDALISDNQTIPNKSTFIPFDSPESIAPPAITTLNVDEFGVKNSIGWGVGAYYHPIDSKYSLVVLPVHKNNKYSAPINIETIVQGNIIKFNITHDSKYECVRMVAEQNNIRVERIEYFKNNKVTYDMEVEFIGNINIWVQAYYNEINDMSERTHRSVTIV